MSKRIISSLKKDLEKLSDSHDEKIMKRVQKKLNKLKLKDDPHAILIVRSSSTRKVDVN